MRRLPPSVIAQRRGAALVITLAVLVLITALLVLFFNESVLNRQISFSSAGEYRADVTAHTALDTIVGDLRSEIIAASTKVVTSPNSSNIYVPYNKSTATTVAYYNQLPHRTGSQGFTNLVAQSISGSNFWSGSSTYYSTTVASPIRSVANNNTAIASANGRFIGTNRWNAPGLLGDPGTGATLQIPSNYTPPDWVVVTRQGPIVNATTSMPSLATLANKNSANMSYAIGRYAYTIYDEGALLDANVAGCPSSLQGGTFTTQRGTMAQVDLSNLFAYIGDVNGGSDAANLVAWRNANSASSAQNYSNYVASATNGFMTVAAGDQAFVGRQDLINYVKNNSVPTAVLQYLGTFSRDVDGPSYFPVYSANLGSAGVETQLPASLATISTTTNVDVLAVRAQSAFTRASDGTTAVSGEPLIKHRFPLSYIGLMASPSGTTTIGGVTKANSAWIQQFFALQQANDGYWDYVDPDSGVKSTTLPAILTLTQVASTKAREPDFWELLQGGIYWGSLGANVTAINGLNGKPDLSTARQVFTIGLSIMDQYLPNTTPVVMRLGGENPSTGVNDMFIAGDENVPYVSWMAQSDFVDLTDAGPTINGTNYVFNVGYLMMAMWNPHRNLAAPPSSGQFRFNANTVNGPISRSIEDGIPGNSYTDLGAPGVTHNNTYLYFKTTGSRYFNTIDGLRTNDADLGATTGLAEFPTNSGANAKQVGLLMGINTVPAGPIFSVTTNSTIYANGVSNIYDKTNSLNIALEQAVTNSAGTLSWVPYQMFSGYDVAMANNGFGYPAVSTNMNMIAPNGLGFTNTGSTANMPAVLSVVHSDPRTVRLGFNSQGGGITPEMFTNNFNMVFTGNKQAMPYNPISSTPVTATMSGWANIAAGGNNASTNFVGDYVFNTLSIPAPTANNHYYSDVDGIIRQGDFYPNPTEIASDQHLTNSPFLYGSARPVMLNRPFTSVAEMGYAFRDDPWRSLDFASVYSADGGLLELFCLNPNQNALRAGVLDINGASQPVLTAVLTGAYQDPLNSSGSAVSPSMASNMAAAIRGQLGPLTNPAMVINNGNALPMLISQMATNNASWTNNFTFKYQRETVARSLADIMNTRTWNLMIDVIAQSGRYTSASKNYNDFVVEGERRYWLHVAIDRMTGAVVDAELEPVSE
jgi:Tfp pilus assembly protein PilX